MTSASMVMPTRRVEMWFGGTAPQRRVTVIFRFILAIPQFIVLFFLGIAAFFVLIVGWFGALFTGQLPEFAHTFLGGVIRWEIRVNAYVFLLTDTYPPFSLEDLEYPVRTILPTGGPLNRVSVFFRIILAIPAGVFAQIVLNGLSFPLLFVMWIVVIVTGRMPPPLYDAYAALLRYQARFHSWFTMITSEYAWGMLGDFVPAPQASSPPATGAVGAAPTAPTQPPPTQPPPAQPPPAQAPPAQAQPFSYPSSGEQVATPPPDAAGAGTTPPSYPPPQPAPAASAPGAPGAMPPPSSWERTSVAASMDPLPPWGILVLRGAARSWMIFAIVWGSIVFIGENAFRGSGNHHHAMSGEVHAVPADTSGLSHIVVHTPTAP
jgi:Domain of unknown function (DUF4389)